MSKKKQKTPIQIARDVILNFVTDEWWLNEHRPPGCDCAGPKEALLRVVGDEATSEDEKQAASEVISLLGTDYDIAHAAPHFDILLGPSFLWCDKPFTVTGYIMRIRNTRYRTVAGIKLPEDLNVVEDDS